MALDCAPSTVQAKRTGAAIPVELARPGMSGKSAGVTTPVVELKKLMMAPMMEKAIGIKGFGTLLPTQLLSMVMVPALTATAISMPAPAGIASVVVGIVVAILGKWGVDVMTNEPQIVVSILVGTIIGVIFFKGVPVGPMIASGIFYMFLQIFTRIFGS